MCGKRSKNKFDLRKPKIQSIHNTRVQPLRIVFSALHFVTTSFMSQGAIIVNDIFTHRFTFTKERHPHQGNSATSEEKQQTHT